MGVVVVWLSSEQQKLVSKFLINCKSFVEHEKLIKILLNLHCIQRQQLCNYAINCRRNSRSFWVSVKEHKRAVIYVAKILAESNETKSARKMQGNIVAEEVTWEFVKSKK